MTIAPVEAASGQTFRLVLDLDNFEVAGLARADFTGVQIRVREGDLSSNNTTTFSLNGQLKAHTVDVGSGVSWNASGSSSETITRKCSSTNAC